MKRPTKAEPLRSPLHCVMDSFDDGIMLGWAHDPSAAGRPARFYVLVDGEQAAEAVCTTPRPDVAQAGLGPEVVGFRVALPPHLLDGQPHHMEFRDIRRLPVLVRVNEQPTVAFDFTVTPRAEVRSYVDGLRSGGFEGWVLRGRDGHWEGGCAVRVTCEGRTIGHARANRVRADVGRALGAPPQCGFRFVPPASTQRGRKLCYRFYLMPGDHELEQSPLTVSLVSDESEARLLDLSDTVDRMHVDLTRLRRQLRELVPQPAYVVEDYDDWQGVYARALRRRVLAARSPVASGGASNGAAPAGALVSVVCPVYRPVLDEFRAAVDSVIAQTHANWELILVDDGSKDLALTACIDAYAGSDPRIKARPMARNGGISRATNAALAAASGAWVAFFDHDDLLADVALEAMLQAAQATGAKLLYSDEDKVDASGRFSLPAFKPDWSHRLLLGVNYVCHLLFVARTALDAVGPLDSRYNGAQDHDLVLRLSERLPLHEIAHVPDILYHWRITAASTALDMGAKPYAAAAGLAAVDAHLQRLGRPATVTAIRGATLYRQQWHFTEEPSVEIIIPFKDEAATTRRCLEAVLSGTDYGNYRVTLVDNWSTGEEARMFCAQLSQAAGAGIRVLRVEEPFNYSRLNNLAAEASDAAFLVLMNNDLFVSDPQWLRTCVNEALADPAVAVVGGKFLYPSRAVQHGGVILGLGGVAGHVGVGLGEDDYGYAGRLLFAQDYAAVTAAGMLVRHDVFKAVGRLDERNLTVAFNDIDLCMRVRAAGWKVIWTPDFLAEHHESLSRGSDERPAQETRFFHETEWMKERWGASLLNDPFYNKNFSLERGPFTELRPPEEAAARDWTVLAPPPVAPASTGMAGLQAAGSGEPKRLAG